MGSSIGGAGVSIFTMSSLLFPEIALLGIQPADVSSQSITLISRRRRLPASIMTWKISGAKPEGASRIFFQAWDCAVSHVV